MEQGEPDTAVSILTNTLEGSKQRAESLERLYAEQNEYLEGLHRKLVTEVNLQEDIEKTLAKLRASQ